MHFYRSAEILGRFPRRGAHGCGQKCPRSMLSFARLRTEMSALHAVVRTVADRNVRAPCRRSHGCGQKCPRSMLSFARLRTEMSALHAVVRTVADRNVRAPCCRSHGCGQECPRSTRSATPAPLSLPCSWLTWGQDGAEPDAVDAARRVVAAAIRRPAVERIGVPTAAPKHTVRA